MRVLLIKPGRVDTLGLDRTALVEPLGLEMVAAALPDHDVRLLDLRLEDDLAARLGEFQPDACGIGCSFTTEVYQALDIARRVKDARPECFVFIGGHHPSLRPEDFSAGAVDAILIGEAETTVSKLVDAVGERARLERVPGLVLNEAEGQHRTPPPPPMPDLDSLPLPSRDLVSRWRDRYYMGFHRPHALVETARGCPYRCRFCSVWRFYGGRVRYKSPGRVIAELEHASAPHIFFTDDNFLSDVARAHEIADLILARRIEKASYTFQARADTIARHPDLLAHWRDVGPISVFMGMEKIDDAGLDALRKNSTAADNEKALSILKGLGVGFSCNFIVSPDADREEFERLRRYVRASKLHNASYSVLTPLPGTELYDEMEERLTTRDYELFDLFHAVTPPRLPLSDFYAEFASLWAASRSSSSRLGRRSWKLVKALATRRTTLTDLRRGINMAKTLSDPRIYLEGHRRSRRPAPA